MKKLTTALCTIAIIILVACNSSTVEKNSSTTQVSNKEESGGGTIVGTWIPIGMDFNVEGKTEPSGDWHYTNKQDSINVKEAGLAFEDGNLNFKANGTGFMGLTETKDGDGAFKYKKMSEDKWCFDDADERNTNAKNIQVFYIDTKGQLIHHTSSEPLLVGQRKVQNSFELYKRK